MRIAWRYAATASSSLPCAVSALPRLEWASAKSGLMRIAGLGRDQLSSLVGPHSGRQQLSGWGTQFCSSATLFAVHRRTLISNWPIAYCTRAMEKLLLICGCCREDLLTASPLYRPWRVLLALAKNPFETVYADGRTVLISQSRARRTRDRAMVGRLRPRAGRQPPRPGRERP
jgi:hypothetical protein